MKENISNIEKKLRRFEKKHDININWDKIEMKKQTAVEWLAEQFDNIVELYPSQFEEVNKVIEQAKEMEKKQIIETAYFMYMNGTTKYPITAEQYYKENYEL